MKEEYNWWTDPKNKEEVDRASWWNHSENRTVIELPVAVVAGTHKDKSNYFVASFSDETKEMIGDIAHGCGQGNTKEEAIKRLFDIVKIGYKWEKEERLNYQRWVPLRVGPWKHTAGKWFTVFGIHMSFRYGKNMKYGWYIPFTKLNVSFSSDWAAYRRYKAKMKET